ncbi:hypothetical protein LguiB_018023 [Lonicera macranthoides]
MKPILSCTNKTTTATDLDSFTKNYNLALSVASTSSVADESLCSYYVGNQTNSLGFQDMAGEFLRKMSMEAPKNGGFYFGMNLYQNTGEAIYGAAQCLEYVNDTMECERCLTSAATKGKECLSRPEGIVLNYGCFMTYAPYNFYCKYIKG